MHFVARNGNKLSSVLYITVHYGTLRYITVHYCGVIVRFLFIFLVKTHPSFLPDAVSASCGGWGIRTGFLSLGYNTVHHVIVQCILIIRIQHSASCYSAVHSYH